MCPKDSKSRQINLGIDFSSLLSPAYEARRASEFEPLLFSLPLFFSQVTLYVHGPLKQRFMTPWAVFISLNLFSARDEGKCEKGWKRNKWKGAIGQLLSVEVQPTLFSEASGG